MLAAACPSPQSQVPWVPTGCEQRCSTKDLECLVPGQGWYLPCPALPARLPSGHTFLHWPLLVPQGPLCAPTFLGSEARIVFPASHGFFDTHSSSVLKMDRDHFPSLSLVSQDLADSHCFMSLFMSLWYLSSGSYSL